MLFEAILEVWKVGLGWLRGWLISSGLVWAILGTPLGHLEAILGHLEAILGHLEAILRPS